jgi:hypothetical protein
MSPFRQYSQAQTLVLQLNGAAITITSFGHGLISNTTQRGIPGFAPAAPAARAAAGMCQLV